MKPITLALAMIAVLLASCNPFAGVQLSNARSRWQSAHITHYSFDFRVACFCAFMDKMPLSIEVQDGRVVSMKYSDGSPVPAEQQQAFASYQTIDAIFDFAADSLARADEIKVAYDPTYGIPDSVEIDFVKDAMDDELSLFVTAFEPLP